MQNDSWLRSFISGFQADRYESYTYHSRRSFYHRSNWCLVETWKLLYRNNMYVPRRETGKLHFQWSHTVQLFFLFSLIVQLIPKKYPWKEDHLKMFTYVHFCSSKYVSTFAFSRLILKHIHYFSYFKCSYMHVAFPILL